MDRIIVLNRDMQFLSFTTIQKALRLLALGKAQPAPGCKEIAATFKYAEGLKRMIVPRVIQLMKMVRAVFRARVPFSKKNIFVRDGYICAYCGEHLERNQATVDHVIPRAKGGKSTWENCVCSCRDCNNYKGDSSLRDISGMSLKKRPYRPTIAEFTMMHIQSLGINELLADLGVY